MVTQNNLVSISDSVVGTTPSAALSAPQAYSLSPIELRVLAAASRSPWASTRQISDEAELLHDHVRSAAQNLELHGLLRCIRAIFGSQPNDLYALTTAGLTSITSHLRIPASTWMSRTLQSPARYWAMRVSLDAIRASYGICARLLRSRHVQGEQVSWELFVPRQYRGASLYLHARINITPNITPDLPSIIPTRQLSQPRPRALYLLVDSDQCSVWVWWRHLRYMQEWSRQASEAFPPLLLSRH